MPIPGAGAGTREWTDWGHSGNPVDLRNVGQSWYRNPSWGGHVVWNPQYGYQDYPTIEKMYSQAQSPMDNQAFQQAFQGAGMQKHLGGTWGTHYGNDPQHRVVPHQEKMMNQYGVPYNPYGAAAQQGGYGRTWNPQANQQQTQGGYGTYNPPQGGGGYNPIQGGDPSTWAPQSQAQTQPVAPSQPVVSPTPIQQPQQQQYYKPQQRKPQSRASAWWR